MIRIWYTTKKPHTSLAKTLCWVEGKFMRKSQAGADRQKNKKVIRLRMDAGFFFERALYYLDRHRYDKAVKYFRLATEKEPGNPVNHCNLAGILSELGRFEESNQVLMSVLEEVDPDYMNAGFIWRITRPTWAIWNWPKNTCCNI